MKNRKTTIAVLAASSLFFAGCSFAPAQNAGTETVQKYAVSESFWKSTDGGKNWEVKDQSSNKPTTKDLDIVNLAVDPANGNNVFLGLRSGGIVKTADGGDNLEFTGFKLDKTYALAISPANPKTMYASALFEKRGKMVKTVDGGEKWDEVYTFPTDGALILSIALDRNNPNTVFASTSDNQVIKSVDGGASWKKAYKAKGPVVKVAIDSLNSDLVYFLTQGGEAFRSQDGGGSFEGMSQAMTAAKLMSSGYGVVETDPTRTGTVYLGGKQGIIKSSDGGKTWINMPTLNDPSTAEVRALAINPSNSNEIVYGAGQATYKSIDGGNSWTTFQFNVGKIINNIEYSRTDPSVVYLGFANK
ncbi:MAG: hypothetical protein HGB08_01635 [Candidatus Moranbacteria bacterium]|nr:hypothetical protein [Candidatus Moranbacteria bacterium]